MKKTISTLIAVIAVLIVTFPAGAADILIKDYFDDGSIDPAKWSLTCQEFDNPADCAEPGDYVEEADGVLKISQNTKDNGGLVLSVPVQVDSTEILVIKKRVKVHYANYYFGGRTGIRDVGNGYAPLGGIAYAYYHYQTTKKGFGVYKSEFGEGEDVYLDPAWDQWVEDELIYNLATGEATYTFNNNSVSLTLDKPSGTSISIELSAWGWYTGHLMEIDWITIEKRPGTCVEEVNGDLDIGGSCGRCGGTISFPVQIQNAPDDVLAMGFDVLLPSSIVYTGFTIGDLIPANYFTHVNFIPPNIVRVGSYKASGSDIIRAGSKGVAVNLEFDLSPECIPGQLNLADLRDDITGWSVSGGCLNLNCCPSIPGDLNYDGYITPADALNVMDAFLGVCPTSYELDCEFISMCADVNEDDDITPADALCIFQKYMEMPESCLNP